MTEQLTQSELNYSTDALRLRASFLFLLHYKFPLVANEDMEGFFNEIFVLDSNDIYKILRRNFDPKRADKEEQIKINDVKKGITVSVIGNDIILQTFDISTPVAPERLVSTQKNTPEALSAANSTLKTLRDLKKFDLVYRKADDTYQSVIAKHSSIFLAQKNP